MTIRSYKTEGIILARRNFGEADKILTVLTKYHGKLRIIAKGIRRTTSRKRGSLELFNQTVLFLAKGKNLDIITEVEVKKNFNAWRGDLLKVGVAYHLCEIVSKLTREGQEVKQVYELMVDSLSELDNVEFWRMHEFILSFKKNVLISLGFLSGARVHEDLDDYIEDLSQSKLKTRRFLRSLA